MTSRRRKPRREPRRERWRLIWTAWLAAIVVSFAALEYLAWDNGITLSRYVSDAGQAFPLTIAMFGALFGGLAVHFYWHWRGK